MSALAAGNKALVEAAVGRALLHTDVPLAGELQAVAGLGQILAPQAHLRFEAAAEGHVVGNVIPHAVPAGVKAGEESGP